MEDKGGVFPIDVLKTSKREKIEKLNDKDSIFQNGSFGFYWHLWIKINN